MSTTALVPPSARRRRTDKIMRGTLVVATAIALVESVYAEVMAQAGDVLMIDTIFEDHSGETAGLLIVAPDPECISLLARQAA